MQYYAIGDTGFTISHHGILGMHWGIRRYQPYGKGGYDRKGGKTGKEIGEAKKYSYETLKAGTKLNSVSYDRDTQKYLSRTGQRSSEQKGWMYTFDPKDKWDSKVYKGPFAMYKMQVAQAYVFEHKFETVKDLKMPVRQERIDKFVEVYSKNKRNSIKELTMIQKMLDKPGTNLTERARKADIKHLKTKDDIEGAYEVFNHMMEAAHRFTITKEYSKLMSEKYDAMVDDNNQGVYNKTNKPIIIFKAEQSLKQIGDSKMVELAEVQKNMSEVRTELNKQGKRMAL